MPTLGSGEYLSFVRLNSTREQGAVLVKFDDSTQFDNALSLGISDFVGGSDLVTFSSDYVTAVASDAQGGFTLLNNHWEAVVITAAPKCTGSPAADSNKNVYANLLASLDDIDLGSTNGLQFQQSGENLVVQVRVNALDTLGGQPARGVPGRGLLRPVSLRGQAAAPRA